jgi:hypothetical protein
LNTKELTEEEKKNRRLDFLGGFEMIDNEMRMFIVEGLGGQGHGMDRFYKSLERDRPSDYKFTMLYNPNVRFKHRLYQDFNCSLKKIRLRESLSKIIAVSDIYLRSKVPEDMYATIQ